MRKLLVLFFCVSVVTFAQQEKTVSDGLILLKIADDFYKEEVYDSVYVKANESLKIFSELKNDSLIIKSYLKLILATGEVNNEEQLKYFNLARTKALNTNNWPLLAETYYTLAKTHYNNREMGAAAPYYLKVDSIAKVHNLKNEITIKSILDRSEISRIAFSYETTEIAHKLQLEALDLAREIENEELIHDTYMRLADMNGLMGNLPEAKRYLDLALNYYLTTDNPKRLARVYLVYMNYYYEVKDYPNAGKKLEEGIAYLKTKNEPKSLARLVSAYGTYYRKRLKNCEKAIPQYIEAKNIYGTLNDTLNDGYLYLLEGLALCNAELQNYEQAYLYYQQTYETKKQIVKKDNNNLSRKLETKYRSLQKGQEIELLSSQKALEESKRINQRNLFLGGLALTTFAGLFFFFQYKNRLKTNRKLKEIDEAKSTFFANISHEFRTPLTLIKGPIEDQLGKTTISQTERKNLLTAQSNTLRLENLVEQLLALSKLESGNLKLQIQPGNLSKLLLVQAEAFAFACKEKGLNYVIDISQDKELDWYDRDAIEKIAFNLIGNSIKYTPEKGSIIVRGEREGNNYIFAVQNSGNYLNIDEQEKIFERFYQTSGKNIGAGIGLSLTRELAELHHGSISVESKVNGYTTFTVTLPVNKAAFVASEILSEELQKEELNVTENPSEEINKTTITTSEDAPILMIVDDNKEIRDYVSRIFEATHKVLTAGDGKEGLELALEHIPDIVISDVMMPVDDGFTLTKNLKENTLTSHIPVILLTAKSAVTDKLEGMDIGADSYVTKPFSTQLLNATVGNLLENRRKLQQRFSKEVILRPKEIAISSADEQFLERLQTVLDERITDSAFSIDDFASEMGVSRMQLYRKLKAITGQTASEFLRSQRLKLAVTMLKSNKISISEAGYAVGFNDPSYFAKSFKKEYGCSPTEYISDK